MDLSRQANTSIPKQINFTEKLEEVMAQQCFLSLKSSKNYS